MYYSVLDTIPLRKRLAWFVPGQALVMLAGGYLGILLYRYFHGGWY